MSPLPLDGAELPTTEGAAPSAERHRERAREIAQWVNEYAQAAVLWTIFTRDVEEDIVAALARVEAKTLERAAMAARDHECSDEAAWWPCKGEITSAIRALASEGRSPEAPEIVQGAPETGGLAPVTKGEVKSCR